MKDGKKIATASAAFLAFAILAVWPVQVFPARSAATARSANISLPNASPATRNPARWWAESRPSSAGPKTSSSP